MKKLIRWPCFHGVSDAARAQDTPVADVAVGYGLIEVPQGFTFMMHGGSGSVALNVNDWLGIVGDFGVYHAHPGVSLTASVTHSAHDSPSAGWAGFFLRSS